MALSKKQQIFVAAYAGDVVEAARIAGYEGTDSYLKKRGMELFNDPKIQKAIVERSKYEVKTRAAVATRQERQEWWTSLMRNEDPFAKPEIDEYGQEKPEGNIPLATRLAASDKLAKSEGDFITQVHLEGNVSITDLIAQSYTPEIESEDLDAIEAEYERLKGGSDEDSEVDSEATDDDSDELSNFI